MTTATGNFPELLWPGIKEIWGMNYKKYKPLWSRALTTVRSDKAFEKFQGVTGLGLAAIKPEGESVTFVDPLQGYQKEAVNVTYGLGAIVTREMYEDEQYTYINSLPKMLAESLRQTQEIIGALPFNNGFGSATTADGVAFFSASHPNVGGGGTQSNMPSVASDLSQASLEQAKTDLMGFKDERGLRINVMPKKLLVAPANWAVAEKILGTKQAVGSNDNDINPVAGMVELIVNPYLTDSDAWFLLTDVEMAAIFVRRRATELSRDNDWETENLKFKNTERYTVTQVDWRGAYASAGA
jgi:hypothetical protein